MVSGRGISDMPPGPSMQLQNGQLDPDGEHPAKNRSVSQNFASFKRSLQLYHSVTLQRNKF